MLAYYNEGSGELREMALFGAVWLSNLGRAATDGQITGGPLPGANLGWAATMDFFLEHVAADFQRLRV